MTRLRRSSRAVAALSLAVLLTYCADSAPITGVAQAPRLATAAAQPALVVCDNAQTKSVSKIIGPRGGQLTVAGSTIEIPAGAVGTPTEFTLSVPASHFLEVDISAAGASHYAFARPALITLGYARCQDPTLDQAELSAWWIDTETKELLQEMGGVRNHRAKAVSFPTDHLSGYTIAMSVRSHDDEQ